MRRSRNRRAALVCMLLLLSLTAGGCVGRIAERGMKDVSALEIAPGMEAPVQDGAERYEMTATLYFLNRDGSALVPVTRCFEVPASGGRVCAALEELLKGPLQDEEGAFWPEIGAMRSERLLEISDGVATVDLHARVRTLPQETIYAVRMAIANTLTGFGEVSYVNVLIGGREEGLDLGASFPVGTISRNEDLQVRDRYNRLNELRLEDMGVTLLSTLYFPSADGAMILPEVRSIGYVQSKPIAYLYTLLEELGKGTHNPLASQNVPAPMDYIVQMPEIMRTEDGYLAICLQMNGDIDRALEEAGLTRGVYLAMLTETLMGFVPGVEGLRVSIGEKTMNTLPAEHTPGGRALAFEHDLVVRSRFAGYVGAPFVLYRWEPSSGRLVRSLTILPQEDGLRERLAALLETTGAQGASAMPEGLTQEDILAVYAGCEEIGVNLSARFAELLSGLTEQEERAAVYAMVNTLTEDTRAQAVRFFFEGEQVQALSGGLEMRGKFLRNPGMVVQ